MLNPALSKRVESFKITFEAHLTHVATPLAAKASLTHVIVLFTEKLDSWVFEVVNLFQYSNFQVSCISVYIDSKYIAKDLISIYEV